MKKTVLIAGAQPEQLEPYACHLKALGFRVCLADSLSAIREALVKKVLCLAIIDLNSFPEINFSFIADMRKKQALPILALASSQTIRTGPDYGVDYMVPLNLSCRQAVSYGVALMHQYGSIRDDFLEESETGRFPISKGDFFLDQWGNWVTVRKEFVRLSSDLCHLMAFFLQNPERLITFQELNRMLWFCDAASCWDEEILVNMLRFKIEPKPDNPVYIRTVPGMGYRFFPTKSLL